MKKYKIFKKKIFEGVDKFESRLNDECRKGYRPISMTSDQSGATLVVLLEKTS